MTRFDFSPLYRSSIGFDHLASLLDAAGRVEQPAYPPYNIELVDEDKYRITMAVAGFDESELSIENERNTLIIQGTKAESANDSRFLHQGIAARNFERKFQLADHVEVVGARMQNGLLHVDLVRVIPEAMKRRKIAIDSAAQEPLLEAQTA